MLALGGGLGSGLGSEGGLGLGSEGGLGLGSEDGLGLGSEGEVGFAPGVGFFFGVHFDTSVSIHGFAFLHSKLYFKRLPSSPRSFLRSSGICELKVICVFPAPLIN